MKYPSWDLYKKIFWPDARIFSPHHQEHSQILPSIELEQFKPADYHHLPHHIPKPTSICLQPRTPAPAGQLLASIPLPMRVRNGNAPQPKPKTPRSRLFVPFPLSGQFLFQQPNSVARRAPSPSMLALPALTSVARSASSSVKRHGKLDGTGYSLEFWIVCEYFGGSGMFWGVIGGVWGVLEFTLGVDFGVDNTLAFWIQALLNHRHYLGEKW